MGSLAQYFKQFSYGAAAFLFVAGIALPVLLIRPAYAAQITTRSIQLSDSTASAPSVTYDLTFTPATTTAVRSVVIDFCAESPLIGSSICTQPTGMTVGTSSPTASIGTWTGALINTSRTLVLTASADQAFNVSTPFNVSVGGFTNSSTIGAFYARVLTFATSAGANSYTAGTPGTHVDDGGVALSTTDDINVTAAVMETLTFCISAVAPGANCTSTSTPSLTLGTGTPPTLATNRVDTVNAYFQLSTNAIGSTYVNMKSSAVSGGLNNGASNAIDPVDHATTPQPIVAGTENFGMQVGTTGSGDSGTVSGDSVYSSATNYNMRFPEVTSTYGDRIASASGAVGNFNVPLKFAATIGSVTSAGIYTANISLIATSSY